MGTLLFDGGQKVQCFRKGVRNFRQRVKLKAKLKAKLKQQGNVAGRDKYVHP
jgi:hypothetical protein